MSAARRPRRVREQRPTWGAEPDLLLDTHIWLRLLDPSLGALRPKVRSVLLDAQQRGGLLVSDFSVWELALKIGRGSLSASLPLREWIDRASQAPGIRHVPIARDVLLAMHEHTSRALADPFDRALSACALTMGAVLVTADRRMLDAAPAVGVRVMSAR